MSALAVGESRAGAMRRLRWLAQDSLVLAERNLRQVTRIPELLVFSTIQPVMFVLLFRYVFGGAIHVGPHVPYVNYLMAGIFVQTVAFGGVSTGIGLADDLAKGIVDRFRSLPMSRLAVLLGRTLADLARNALTVVIMLAVGLIVGFRPHGSALHDVEAVLLLLLFSFAFSWIGATIGLTIGSVEAAQSAGFIWLFPLTFASSAFVATSSMPDGLRQFAENQPISRVVTAVRDWVLGQPVSDNGWIAVVWCVGILLVFSTIALRVYGRLQWR